MFAAELTETEWKILTCIVGDGKVNGFEFDLKPDSFSADPQSVKESFLESGSSAGWLLVDPETKTSFLHEDMEFMLRIVTNPMSSFTCGTKGDNGFLWGCYFRNDTIVLVNQLEDKQRYEIAWVPTISYALGPVYMKLKQWFEMPGAQAGQETGAAQERVLRCSFQTDDNSAALDWTAQEDGSFMFSQEDGMVFPGTQTGSWEGVLNGSFKETFDSVALWIVKAHGNSMRGIIGNG